MAEPKPSFNPHPSKPRLILPRGACDSHFHVFGPAKKFPFAADREQAKWSKVVSAIGFKESN